MNNEYKIEVLMSPHVWDCPQTPYFWVIFKNNNGIWFNTGLCGWAKNPDEAWNQASRTYNSRLDYRHFGR